MNKKTKKTSFLARAAMTLLLAVLTTATAWADSWPEYITDVVLAGGTESEATSVKNSSTYSGYTWCSTSLNDGTSGDVIYIGYKKSSSPAYINGGYITDFIIIDAGTGTEGHNPPYSLTFQGRTYYRCPAAGGDYFVNSNHGNLTSQAANGWNMYLYYTKNNFDDKRAVDGISIYSVGDINEHKSGAINCYYKDGTLHEKEISLNKGVSKTPYVYMHINTVTKTNRPSTDPVMASGLVYNGNEQLLVSSMGTTYDNTYKMYFREIGQNQYFYEGTYLFTKATNAGTYNVEYYAGSSTYGDKSETKIHQVTIAKAANSGVTVACADVVDGNAPAPQLSGNLSTGAVTYQYSTTQNGTYTTTVPTDFGKYWVKATIAGDDNCYAYTTAAASFYILSDANDLWNVKGGANGTQAHPIIISTPSQLDLLAKKVNGTDGYTANNFSGKYFELGDDITYDGTTNNYTAIGTENAQDNVFGGHFDGKGHTVSGINVDTYAQWYKGLFGRIGSTAEVKNVTLSDATITGYYYTSGIVGYNNGGTVENCHVLSTVTVLGTNASAVYHGGIVGSNGGTVRGCTSAATVSYQSATYNMSYYGGIAGCNSGTIQNCLVYGGSVSGTFRVGVVVGNNSGTLTNNHYSGVTLNGSEAHLNAGVGDGSQDGTRYICAIIPYEGVTLSIPSVSATTEYPYNGLKIYSTGMSYNGQYYNYLYNTDTGISGDVTFTATYSGDVPEDYAHSGFGSTSLADNTDVPMEWAATDGTATCTLCTYIATKYYIAPTFRLAVWGNGDGSQGNPYIIKTVRGMNELASKVNSGEGDLGGKYFELGADITYDGTENNYTPIGTSSHKSSVNFDGKGYTISGININTGSEYQGVFGFVAYCTIQNLTLANSTITNGGYSGGIFGKGEGVTVSNCHVTNTVTMHANGTMFGGIGGFAMYNSTIKGCTSAATLSFKWNYYNGGIMGGMNGCTIKDCLYLGPKFDTTENGAILGSITQNDPTLTNTYHTVYGMNSIGYQNDDNANFAVATGTKPDGFGDATATYGTGTYTGITAYGTNGLEYGGKYYWHDADLMVLEDHNTENINYNDDLLVANNGATRNVVLNGRTLYKDGKWNTLCLPFDVVISGSVLDGAVAKTLTSTDFAGGTLTLNFGEAVSTIEAGKPYIIKWESGENIVSPVFENVTISNSTNNAESTYADFTGSYSPTTISGEDKTKLYLGADNKLYYPNAAMTIGACRGYFQLKNGLIAGEPKSVGAKGISQFVLDFGDENGEATGIRPTPNPSLNGGEWYDLSGRRLSGKPATPGLYIHNGNKIVIK
ncbi:MAG: hypothetical protein IJG46_05590 [Prevotella sp.]|nr:hypothetical protein [Prevotella sp.]MBQ6195607.1 hypothetical protein [Prevotella sp.]